MRDRIRPPKELESVLDLLKDKGVFATKQKGMMFAASLGFAVESYLPLESTGEGIRLEYFANVDDAGFVDALAVAHSKTLEILEEEKAEERFEIFEAYAHGGLKRINAQLQKDKNRSELDVILHLVDECKQTRSDRLGKLKGLL